MTRYIYIILIFLTLSGCGLFKKTKKVEKSIETSSSSVDLKVSGETSSQEIDKSIENIVSDIELDEKTKIYPKSGTLVTKNEDGSLSFEADSIIQQIRKKSNEAKEKVSNVIKDLKEKRDSSVKADSSNTSKQYKKDQELKPDPSGILSNYIGFAIMVIIILLFLFWYFNIHRKKKNKNVSDEAP